MRVAEQKTILLVEDEAIIAMAQSIAIKRFGYDVVTANAGERAVEIASGNEEISLILMDIDLGDSIDGPETARRILEKRNIPIVFLTSHMEREYVERVKEITRYGYVIKNSGDFVLRSSIEMAFELFEAHKKMLEREERLRRAEKISGFGNWQFDLTNKTVIASEGAGIIYGLGRENWTIESVQKVPLPQYRPMLDAALRNLIELGEPYDVEFEIKRPTDGRIIFIHSTASYDAEKNFVTGIIHDITERKRSEETIREREESLCITLQSIGDGVIATDIDGSITRMNETAERLTGWNFSDAKGKQLTDIFKIINAETRKTVENPVQKVIDSGKIQGLANHTILLSRGGAEYQIADSAAPIMDKKGNIRGVILVFSDVTEKYKAEELIRENRKQLKDIIEFLPDATMAVDREGRIIIWNRAMEEMTGMSAAEMLGKGDGAYIIPFYGEKRPHLIDLVFDDREDIASRYPIITREGNTFTAVVYCRALYNNKGAWIFAKASPLRDESGNIIGAIESVRDINDHKLMEDALIKSERNYHEIFDSSNDALFIHDITSGAIIDVNKTMLEIYGWADKQEVLKHSIEDFSAVEEGYDSEKIKKVFGSAAENNVHSFEWRAKKKSGEVFWAQVTLRKTQIGGESRIMAFVHDISERKRVEEKIKTLLDEKQLMLREVHHRIKNNMNTVAGIMMLQADTLNDSSAAEALLDARNRVVSMMVLYDKLYRSDDFAEISFLEYAAPLVDEIIRNFPNNAMVKIEKHIEDFMIDAKKSSTLGIIINEILTNIMKYAFAGRDSGHIIVSAGAAGKKATISIHDNGIGIAESFDNLSNGGFGLQLVDMLTRQLRGLIRIERDNGTRFILEFEM